MLVLSHTDILVDPLLLLDTLVSTTAALLDAILVAGNRAGFSQPVQESGFGIFECLPAVSQSTNRD